MKRSTTDYILTTYAILISICLGWLVNDSFERNESLNLYRDEIASVRFDQMGDLERPEFGNRKALVDAIKKNIECLEYVEKLKYEELCNR